MVVKKTKKGWVVKSHSGKNLSRPFKNKADAYKRLGQIEYFKNK